MSGHLTAAFSAIILIFVLMTACGDDNEAPKGHYSPGDVWVDESSGLIWQNGDKGNLTWEEANSYCENLDWHGCKDWRLPTISELRSLIRGCADAEEDGSCGVTDDCLTSDGCWSDTCYGCEKRAGPGIRGRYWPVELAVMNPRLWYWYWSSSTVTDDGTYAWAIDFDYCYIGYSDSPISARCVR